MALGAAVEYLIASFVAHIDPVLLADRNSPLSMVALSRHNKSGRLDLRAHRTAKLTDQVRYISLAFPTLNLAARVDSVMEVRNAAAHAALTGRSAAAEAAVACVSIVGDLHVHQIEWEEEDFWGEELQPLVRELRDVRSTEVSRRVATKLAAARDTVSVLSAGLSDTDRERALSILEGRPVPVRLPHDWQQTPWKCPACERMGKLTYIRERAEEITTESIYDHNGQFDSEWFVHEVYGLPAEFRCSVCGLFLDEASGEMEPFAPMNRQVELQPEPADESVLDWEPDEDWLRGR
ncbi:hypothetical protein ACFVWR_01630 [Leifsonia sp. NPDC058292]|uniref:hypothetical protein n=1 Tax=Leifsonia sp. NPDC058292 TaxID=3346428 RepID=UPI0036DA7CE0